MYIDNEFDSSSRGVSPRIFSPVTDDTLSRRVLLLALSREFQISVLGHRCRAQKLNPDQMTGNVPQFAHMTCFSWQRKFTSWSPVDL